MTSSTDLSLAEELEDKTVEFQSVAALSRKLYSDNSCNDDFVIFKNVSRADFDRIDRWREKHGRKVRFFYQADKQQLCVTIPTWPHETTQGNLTQAIMRALPASPSYYWCGSTTYHHPDGNSQKEADSGGFPDGDTDTDTDWSDSNVITWPTLVIECSMSQSLAGLRAAVHWWFNASEGRVKIVLLVKLRRATRTMDIYKYTQEPIIVKNNTGRPGATTTRSSSRLQPVLQQTITITPIPDSSPARYIATSGALLLDFELLYGRARGPGEQDIIVSEESLQKLARQTWRHR